MKERNLGMVNSFKMLGRAAALIGVLSGVDYGVYSLVNLQQNRYEEEIDARCGGPQRPMCIREEVTVFGNDGGPWGGMPYEKKEIIYVSKEASPVIDTKSKEK